MRDRWRERQPVSDRWRERERETDRQTDRQQVTDRWREKDRQPVRDRLRSRVVKIKNIKKQNLLYGCFKKKQSTQKISNQKMKLKERDKSILEYVQCMYNNVHAYKVPGF